MAPKVTPDAHHAEAMKVVCSLLSTATEFKPDLTEMASHIGIATPKNVPRKINSVLEPYGFEFKSGRVTQKTPATSSNAAPAASVPKAATSKAKSTTTTKSATSSTKGSKKRKLQQDDGEDAAASDEGNDKNGSGSSAGEATEKKVSIKTDKVKGEAEDDEDEET